MKRILALMLVLAMTLVLFAGCTSAAPDQVGEEKGSKAKTEDAAEDDKTEAPADDAEEVEEEDNGDITANKVELKKIGSSSFDGYASLYSVGFTYRDYNAGLYNIVAADGSSETGPKYKYCENVGSVFAIAQKDVVNYGDMTQVNRYGVVDVTGKQILPESFAYIKRVSGSDKYIVAYTATALTTADNYVININNNKYTGTWTVYDVTTGQAVPNVTGTTNDTPSMYGDAFAVYVNGKYVYYTAAGVQITGYTRMFSDGTYSVESKIGEVFNADGTKLFGYDLTGYVPSDVLGDYYTARKYEDGKTRYVLMDKNGLVVSAEFKEYISKVAGELIVCDEKVYDFEGNTIADSEYRLELDPFFGKYYYVQNDDKEFSLIDKKGNVYVTGEETSDTSFDYYFGSFTPTTKKSGDTYVYCYKDADYTIKGSVLSAPWLAKVELANYRYDLVSTLTGEKLLEGYEGLSAVQIEDGKYYIYASGDNGIEIYEYTAK